MFFTQDTDKLGFKQEIHDLLRGIAGGAIFGMPLLYTMELWMNGRLFSSHSLLIILVFTLIVNIVFSYFAGLRENNHSEDFFTAIDDGVTSLVLAIILALLVLILIGQYDLREDQFKDVLGKVVLEACVVSIGITFTNFKFKKTKSNRDLPLKEKFLPTSSQRELRRDLNEFAATMAGAFVYSFNVAPTEEVFLIASKLSSFQLVALLVVEFALCYIILYASGLNRNAVYKTESFFQKPASELIMTMFFSIFVSAMLVLLIGYGGVGLTDSLFIPATVALGLPAVVGGAAGRLVV